jgi:hypothetical protein
MALIKRIVKGSDRTLTKAEVANEVVDAVNLLLDIRVTPEDAGKFLQGKEGLILDLSPLVNRLKELQQKAASIEAKINQAQDEIDALS